MIKYLKKLGFEIIKLISLTAVIILIIYGFIHYILGV